LKVLVAEDDATLQRGLQFVLETIGHQTTIVGDGVHADTLLATEAFDLVVLDLGLPGVDGLAVLQRLRRRRQVTPVLILSARDRTEDRVQGLDSGADDYLTKPFELSEFEARVRALLRRGQGATVEIGKLQWSWTDRQARIADVEIALSQHEATLIEALMQTPGKVVAKQLLASRIGGDNMVEVYIHRLRRKLTDAGVELRTVRGFGYLLREIDDHV
jgi:two-component system, OmpR family, response regulator